MADFRNLLADLKSGNRAALDQMMPTVYAELRRLAESYMVRERSDHTLQPTALVHEAYIRLIGQESVDWRNRAQVLGLAARMMRRVLIDHAVGRNAVKRMGMLVRTPLTDDVRPVGPSSDVDVLDLERALEKLEQVDPQQAHVVELRFFGGLTIKETADAIGISEATVEREWATARLWILRRIGEERAE